MQYLKTRTSHSIWKWRLIPRWLICLALTLFHVMPAWGITIGYIDSFNGTHSDFKLMRGEHKIQVARNISLHEGDTVIVNKFGSSITLELVDSENVTLNFDSPKPYPIKRAYPSNTVIGNLTDIFSDWWGGLWENPEEERGFARSKGGKLAIPLLEKNNANLIVGKSMLSLAWRGGVAPYHVKIQQSHAPNKSCCRWEKGNIPSTNVVLKKLDLKQLGLKEDQYYLVTVTDIHGKNGEVEGKFKVVNDTYLQENLPKAAQIKKELQDARKLPSSNKQNLWATWLTHQGEKWGFEAYQHVAGIDEFEPARRLKKALEITGTYTNPNWKHPTK